jgi:hypothetical protein
MSPPIVHDESLSVYIGLYLEGTIEGTGGA